MAQIVRFVDRPQGSVLLDLSPGVAGLQVGDGGVSAPPPQLNRTISESPMLDGGVVGASSYGLRTVKIPLVFTSGLLATDALSAAARRAAVQGLLKIVDQPWFWLEVRSNGSTEGRYLRVYRAEMDVAAALDGLGSRWMTATLEFPADPFALGPKETLSALTHNEAGDFKQTILASTIKGDVPAPVEVRFDIPNTETGIWTLFMASKTGGLRNKVIVDFSTLANGTAPAGSTYAANVADVAAMGGTTDQWNTIALGQEMIVGSGNVIQTPAGGNGSIAGLYRVFLKTSDLATTFDGDAWQYRMTVPTEPAWSAYFPEQAIGTQVQATMSSGIAPTFIDLGLVECPLAGAPPGIIGYDANLSIKALALRVYAKFLTAGGAGTRSKGFDTLLVVPADESFLSYSYGASGTTRTHVLDSVNQQVGQIESSQIVSAQSRTYLLGDTPEVSPAADVGIVCFRVANGAAGLPLFSPAPGNMAVTWTPNYWPRYLTVV